MYNGQGADWVCIKNPCDKKWHKRCISILWHFEINIISDTNISKEPSSCPLSLRGTWFKAIQAIQVNVVWQIACLRLGCDLHYNWLCPLLLCKYGYMLIASETGYLCCKSTNAGFVTIYTSATAQSIHPRIKWPHGRRHWSDPPRDVPIPLHLCNGPHRCVDHLLQICLHGNEINIVMSGINFPAYGTNLDANRINHLQTLCTKFGQELIKTFDINANAKVQKMMRHLQDQLQDFGSVLWLSNALNETSHKDTKIAFWNTDKRPDLLPDLFLNYSRSGYQRFCLHLSRERRNKWPQLKIAHQIAHATTLMSQVPCVRAPTYCKMVKLSSNDSNYRFALSLRPGTSSGQGTTSGNYLWSIHGKMTRTGYL